MPTKKKADKLDPAEKLFIDFLTKFSDDDVTDAIEEQMDLARIAREELAEELPYFRMLARAYVRAHPSYKGMVREQQDRAVKKIIEGIARVAPEKAKRILEGPPVFKPEDLGLQFVPGNAPNPTANPNPGKKYPEDGIEYVRNTLEGFRRLLCV